MKKIILFMGLIFTVFIACEDDLQKDQLYIGQRVVMDSNAEIDCPIAKTVPLKGHTIEIPFFVTPITCNDIPYPSGFKDVGGKLTHLGNVEGGFLEFINCMPTMNSETEFSADFTGEFLAANNDKVFYQGTLIFDMMLPGQGTSNCTITGGTGRWKNAKGCFRYYDVTPLPDGKLKVYVDGKITPPGAK